MSKITVAHLTCGQCNNDFPLNLNVKPESITCPFCQSDVEDNMIEDIYRAALSVWDLNYHFRKYHSERNENLFELSVKEKEVSLPVDNN